MPGIHRIAAAVVLVSLPAAVHAQGVRVLRELPNTECRSVRETDQTRAGNLPQALVEPRRGADMAATVGSTVVVVQGQRANGFVGVMLPDGRAAWLDERWTTRWRSLSDPDARCTPAVLSNGRIGFSAK